jgi:hypothetical protein
MNSARALPKSPSVKPPPLPASHARPPDDDVTSETEVPREVLEAAARSDVRELRVPRPAAPRPTLVPRPEEPAAKKRSVPPPLPASAAPVAATVDESQRRVAMVPGPPTIPDDAVEFEAAAMRPRPLVFVRTVWFFGAFVAGGALRWMAGTLSRGVAWLASEWRRAADRAT